MSLVYIIRYALYGTKEPFEMIVQSDFDSRKPESAQEWFMDVKRELAAKHKIDPYLIYLFWVQAVDTTAPRPGNSNFSDDEIAKLPVVNPTPSQMLDDITSRPIDDMKIDDTVQFWFCPATGHGYDVIWYQGMWCRCPNGSRREFVGLGGYNLMNEQGP